VGCRSSDRAAHRRSAGRWGRRVAVVVVVITVLMVVVRRLQVLASSGVAAATNCVLERAVSICVLVQRKRHWTATSPCLLAARVKNVCAVGARSTGPWPEYCVLTAFRASPPIRHPVLPE
jgi:hypothetical protein